MLKSSLRIAQGKNVLCRNLVTSPNPHAWIFSKEASKSTGHSSLLANRNEVYEVRVEDVSPAKWEDYLKNKGKYLVIMVMIVINYVPMII